MNGCDINSGLLDMDLFSGNLCREEQYELTASLEKAKESNETSLTKAVAGMLNTCKKCPYKKSTKDSHS